MREAHRFHGEHFHRISTCLIAKTSGLTASVWLGVRQVYPPHLGLSQQRPPNHNDALPRMSNKTTPTSLKGAGEGNSKTTSETICEACPDGQCQPSRSNHTTKPLTNVNADTVERCGVQYVLCLCSLNSRGRQGFTRRRRALLRMNVRVATHSEFLSCKVILR